MGTPDGGGSDSTDGGDVAGGGDVEATQTTVKSEPKTSTATTTAASSTIQPVYGTDDALFGCIERNQLASGKKTFGNLLDAGTGSHSLRWIASLVLDEQDKRISADTYTAVTADDAMQRRVEEEAHKLGINSKGTIVVGNWATPLTSSSTSNHDPPSANRNGSLPPLCEGIQYDTILADYLVGAIDGFSPYFQDQIFPRLATHLKPGGRLYVVGLNPIPDNMPNDPDADIFCRVTKLRDACIMLAGHRCYREYPVDWIHRHLQLAGLEVLDTSKYPILYSHNAIVRQLNVARSKLPYFPNKALVTAMAATIDSLEKHSKEATSKSPTGRIKLGYDYVITAEKPQ